jgi:putative FmdB family regulatory protein
MIYPYQCKGCSHEWDVTAKIADPPPKECPECGAPEPKRLIARGGSFQLKGGGWADSGYGSTS